MQLNSRLRKLERQAGAVGTCPVCQDQGQCGMGLVINGVDLEPIEGIGCPRCHKEGSMLRIAMDLKGDGHARERFVITRLFKFKDPEEAATAEAMARWAARGSVV